MSDKEKLIACTVIVLATAVVYCIMNGVWKLQEKYPNATPGTWIRRKIYWRGYTVVRDNMHVECGGNFASIGMMMIGCYQAMRARGMSKEELRKLLEDDRMVEKHYTTTVKENEK